ncbi:MAG TPA: hypothetical protein VGI66_16160 [Streptosporangiaceae bacterium]
MSNPGIAHLPKPGIKVPNPGKPTSRQRPLRAVPAGCNAEDHSPVHDWVQSQLHKLGDIIRVIDHGGILLDKNQAVIARRALMDAYAYRGEMLADAPDSDMIRQSYLGLFKEISDSGA